MSSLQVGFIYVAQQPLSSLASRTNRLTLELVLAGFISSSPTLWCHRIFVPKLNQSKIDLEHQVAVKPSPGMLKGRACCVGLASPSMSKNSSHVYGGVLSHLPPLRPRPKLHSECVNLSGCNSHPFNILMQVDCHLMVNLVEVLYSPSWIQVLTDLWCLYQKDRGRN